MLFFDSQGKAQLVYFFCVYLQGFFANTDVIPRGLVLISNWLFILAGVAEFCTVTVKLIFPTWARSNSWLALYSRIYSAHRKSDYRLSLFQAAFFSGLLLLSSLPSIKSWQPYTLRFVARFVGSVEQTKLHATICRPDLFASLESRGWKSVQFLNLLQFNKFLKIGLHCTRFLVWLG